MTHDEIKAFLASKDKSPKDIPGMAWEVWEDGEITLTKCSNGELYGQRNLHQMSGPTEFKLPLDLFPHPGNTHASVICDNEADCKEIRSLIVNIGSVKVY
jgi:hypothetical protein